MHKLFLLILVLVLPGIAGADDSVWRWSGVERVVAFADVHGAYNELVHLLQTTDVIDTELKWIGGQAHLVSTGDLLDRGPDSRKVMDLLMRLQTEAAAAGGSVHVLLGNHELMNLTGDLRYVSTQEYQAFAAEEPADVRESAFQQFLTHNQMTAEVARAEFDQIYPPGYFALRAAFAPDGKYGSWLLDLPLIIVVNRTAFTHGGLPPLVTSLGLEETNRQLRTELNEFVTAWQQLLSKEILPLYADALQSNEIVEKLRLTVNNEQPDADKLEETFSQFLKSDIFDDDGPLWYRGTATCHPLLETSVTRAALAKLNVDRVVVGHTPTADHRVKMRMDDQVVVLDTGMLGFYYNGIPSALIIEDEKLRIVYDPDSPQNSALQDDVVIEAFLSQASIESLNTKSNTLVLQDGTRPVPATFRSDSDYRREIAAYRIDRMLGLGMVPITVERKIAGRKGALSRRIKGYFNENDRVTRGIAVPSWCASGNEFDLMYAFDALVGNKGRSRENMLYFGPDMSLRLTGFDHSFGTGSDFPTYLTNAELSLSPYLKKQLEMLGEDDLNRELAGLLPTREIKALLKRRDVMLKTWPVTGENGQNP